MVRRPIIVLADDLTGAAEVGALAHELGLRVVVVTKVPRAPIDTDVLVLDTDTRLVTPVRARARIKSRAERLRRFPHSGVFKKTDSVLRGPVRAELSSCATAFGFARTLLIAGNPSLGRTIRAGRCYIHGQAIDQTPFARDPHHPAKSAEVLDLLHAAGRPGVYYLQTQTSLPPAGLIVGEHACAEDTAAWAHAVDETTLPAGSADFFRAWLANRITARPQPIPRPWPAGPALLLHGTAASSAGKSALFFSGLRPPSPRRVSLALRQHPAVTVAPPPRTLNDSTAPTQIAQGFGELALALREDRAFRHLFIAGGATAASVLKALRWQRLSVVRVWAPGVVSLLPDDPAFTVTLKPGSYPWPPEILHLYSRLVS